jgi:predicted RNA methylase
LGVKSADTRPPYKVEITEVGDENADGAVGLADVEYLLKNKKNVLTLLNGNGDFRSAESVKLLEEVDIVVTNPPFSLFREYVAQLVEHDKKFIIIGSKNAITYKDVFKHIQEKGVLCPTLCPHYHTPKRQPAMKIELHETDVIAVCTTGL